MDSPQTHPESLGNEDDSLSFIRSLTPARLGLSAPARAIPTSSILAFKAAHAMAKDAVLDEWDVPSLAADLSFWKTGNVQLQSQVDSKRSFLLRPDAGRRLNDQSLQTLQSLSTQTYDIQWVIADGLCAKAVQYQAVELLQYFESQHTNTYTQAPIAIVSYGRVAIADEIAQATQSKASIILIGERPGLSSFDSMGIYLTFGPQKGLTDESRNCISNVRPQGLSIPAAVHKINKWLEAAFSQQRSGVSLIWDTLLGT